MRMRNAVSFLIGLGLSCIAQGSLKGWQVSTIVIPIGAIAIILGLVVHYAGRRRDGRRNHNPNS